MITTYATPELLGIPEDEPAAVIREQPAAPTTPTPAAALPPTDYQPDGSSSCRHPFDQAFSHNRTVLESGSQRAHGAIADPVPTFLDQVITIDHPDL